MFVLTFIGKTTSAASWAMRLADSGFKTLVVSSDPAHSLGDAFQLQLNGVPKLIDIPTDNEEVWAMEIDPVEALKELKAVMGTDDIKSNAGKSGSLGGLGDELKSLLADVNDVPAGADEVVALVKVLQYLERGYTNPRTGENIKFERIVLDTAPTGHTLRMLDLPTFLQEFVQRVRKIRDKAGSIGSVFGMFGDSKGEDDPLPKEDKMLAFEDQMKRLEKCLHDPKFTEFAVVTIPTEVAMAETKRLLSALKEDSKILVRRVLVNQVLPELTSMTAEQINNYLQRAKQGQAMCITDIQTYCDRSRIPVVQVPYYSNELRTIYGLRFLGKLLFPNQ